MKRQWKKCVDCIVLKNKPPLVTHIILILYRSIGVALKAEEECTDTTLFILAKVINKICTHTFIYEGHSKSSKFLPERKAIAEHF